MRTQDKRYNIVEKLFPTCNDRIRFNYLDHCFSEAKTMIVFNVDDCKVDKLTGKKLDKRVDNLMCENYCHMYEGYRGLMVASEIEDYVSHYVSVQFERDNNDRRQAKLNSITKQLIAAFGEDVLFDIVVSNYEVFILL